MPHNKPKNGVPSAAEFGLLRAYLAQNGVSQADITDAIGIGAQGRSRDEITTELRDWYKTRPKA